MSGDRNGATGSTLAPASANFLAAASTAAFTSASTGRPEPASRCRPILRPLGSSGPALQSMVAGGRLMWSRGSGFDSSASSSAESAAVRVIGPMARPKYGGSTGTRPRLGFKAQMPLPEAGRRSGPPVSGPRCRGPQPAAAAAPAPALEPPGFQARFQGLRVSGWNELRPD